MRPEEAFCIGGSWRVPVACGLLSKDFVKDLKDDGTYSPLTFAREYESKWGGGNVDSFFSGIEFDKNRIIQKPLWEALYRPERGTKIILSYDVGRLDDNSSLLVIQLTPSPVKGNGTYTKKIVNIYSLEKMHFKDQAFLIKKLFFQFKANKIVLDANGLGVGLLDFLTIKTENEKTGEVLPIFGVDKESDKKGNYKKFYNVPNGINDAIYFVKANGGSNSEMHNLCSAQISSGKVHFLIDEQLAEDKLKRTEAWKTYSLEKRVELLRPYKLTKVLREEMLNLKKTGEGGNMGLKQISSGVKKDKFSALEYGIWYARQLELKNKNNGNITKDMSFCTVGKSVFDRNNSSIRDRFSGGERRWSRD